MSPWDRTLLAVPLVAKPSAWIPLPSFSFIHSTIFELLMQEDTVLEPGTPKCQDTGIPDLVRLTVNRNNAQKLTGDSSKIAAWSGREGWLRILRKGNIQEPELGPGI